MKEKIIKLLCEYANFLTKEEAAIKFEALINQEVEKRIAERMPSEEEIEKHFTTPHYHYEKGHYYKVRKDRIFGAKWLRSRLTKPGDSQKTEGGGE